MNPLLDHRAASVLIEAAGEQLTGEWLLAGVGAVDIERVLAAIGALPPTDDTALGGRRSALRGQLA